MLGDRRWPHNGACRPDARTMPEWPSAASQDRAPYFRGGAGPGSPVAEWVHQVTQQEQGGQGNGRERARGSSAGMTSKVTR